MTTQKLASLVLVHTWCPRKTTKQKVIDHFSEVLSSKMNKNMYTLSGKQQNTIPFPKSDQVKTNQILCIRAQIGLRNFFFPIVDYSYMNKTCHLTFLVMKEVLVHLKGSLNWSVLIDLCTDVVQETRHGVGRGSKVLVLFVVDIVTTLASSLTLWCALLLATWVVLACRENKGIPFNPLV